MNSYAVTALSTANAASSTDADASLHCKGGAAIEKDVRIGGNLYCGVLQATSTAYNLATSSLTIAATDSYFMIECSYAGAVTITLPLASAAPGRQYFIVKTAAVTSLTISTQGTDTIDGITSTSLIVTTTGYVKVNLLSNGSPVGGNPIWYTI